MNRLSLRYIFYINSFMTDKATMSYYKGIIFVFLYLQVFFNSSKISISHNFNGLTIKIQPDILHLNVKKGVNSDSCKINNRL